MDGQIYPSVSPSELLDIRACPVGDDFAKYVWPFSLDVTLEKGVGESAVFGTHVTALHMVAICVQETGWGESVRSKMGNNIAGIHASGDHPKFTAVEGMTGKKQDYRYFRSFQECLYALHYLIRHSHNFDLCRDAFLSRFLNAKTEQSRRECWAVFFHDFSSVYSEDPEHGIGVIRLFRMLEGRPFFKDA